MKSPLRWIGGKSKLYKKIISIMPIHKCYVEPFAGGLWVLLNKPKTPVEVANDINHELVNFYKVLQKDYNKLKEKFLFSISSREIFNEYLHMPQESIAKMDNVERAARFLYLNRCSHSGRMISYGFSNSRRSNLCPITDDFDKIIGQVHYRIKDVNLENGDYKEMIRRYDKRLNSREQQDVLFYFDPPYKNVYDYEGTGIDYEELANEVYNMNGKWIVSINDDINIKNSFKKYTILGVSISETIANSGENAKNRNELIICNYKISQIPDWATPINLMN